MARVTVSTPSATPAPAPKAPAMPQATGETPEQELARLRAENQALRGNAQAGVRIRINAKGVPTGRHGAIGKGTVSLFGVPGLGRFGLTLYPRGWSNLLTTLGATGPVADAISGALRDHAAVLDFGTTGD